MKKKIYIKQWLEQKPYSTQTSTDSYYIKLSNDIKTALLDEGSFVLMRYLNETEIDVMSCFLASYFEDIISETNIWNSFVNTHYKLYDKKLPFYNTDEYYENEINEQDVSFLIWYFLNTIQEEKFINPFNNFIVGMASKVMLILDEEYEYAPENNLLKTFYRLNEDENDYYAVRNFIDIILVHTYLFFPDTSLKLKNQQEKIVEENRENLVMFLRDNRDTFLNQKCTRLLGLKGKEWGAEILGKNHPLSADLLNMSQRISGLFFYKGQDEDNIYIEHIASGKKFNLTKKSFDQSSELKEIDTMIFLGIVQWKNEWWFSGITFQASFNADVILEEKNSLQSRMVVNFLDHKKEDTINLLQLQLNAFLSFNNGLPIAFLPSDKIDDFYKGYIEFFNNSLNLSDEEREQAENRAKEKGFFGNKDTEKIDYTEVSETGLVFFNPNSGGEIALDVNSAFPLKGNPFYKVQNSENAIMCLFMSEELSTELAKYCIDNCKNDLPFFKEGIGKRYLEDIDFLLRFWKKENYFSEPSITSIG